MFEVLYVSPMCTNIYHASTIGLFVALVRTHCIVHDHEKSNVRNHFDVHNFFIKQMEIKCCCQQLGREINLWAPPALY